MSKVNYPLGRIVSLICYALFVSACILTNNLVVKAEVPVQSQVRSILSEASPIIEPVINIIAGSDSKSQDKTFITCTGEWMGSGALSITNWYTGGEYYAVYQDPIETGCTNTYPFGVESVSWQVDNVSGGPLTLELIPVIYTADTANPTCPKPGVVCCRGPQYTITFPNPGSFIVTLPLGEICCVTGPYFAGVESPIFIGPGLLNVVTDNGNIDGGLFPLRTCASYNNYLGKWEDLIVDYGFAGNLVLWSDGINADENSCDDCVGNPVIEAGVDLWQTPNDGNTVDSNFTVMPIPPDFFGPGSDPFAEPIPLMGEPLVTNPSGVLGETDAIVERLAPVSLPTIGSSNVIEIEIVALSLVSSQPITVTYNGGMNPELWDVKVCLSEQTDQQTGTMTIDRVCCNGGTFTANLPVSPKFIFNRQSDGAVLVLDLGGMMQPIDFSTQNGYWSEDIPAPFDLVTSPGLVQIDHDCHDITPNIIINPSSKFTAGMRTIPCDLNNPDSPCVGKVLTLEQAALSAHGVLPVQEVTPLEGACCLPDGDCVVTTQECCEQINSGTYLGDYTSCDPGACDNPNPPIEDCVDVTGQFVFTFDPNDFDCQLALPPVELSAINGLPMIIQREAPPYQQGDIIQTEILQLELTGTIPDVGPVMVHLDILNPSLGQVGVNSVDGNGELTSGDSFFDVYYQIEFLNLAMSVTTNQPIPLVTSVSALPPIGETYITQLSYTPIEMIDIHTQQVIGWICYNEITIEAPCAQNCCIGIRGNVDGVGGEPGIDIADLVYFVDYAFSQPPGPEPPCMDEADVDGSGGIDIADIVYMVDYMFSQPPGPEPVQCAK